jgi:hypothetical protein
VTFWRLGPAPWCRETRTAPSSAEEGAVPRPGGQDFFAVFFAGAFFAVPELDELFLAVPDELFFAGAFFAVPELDELFLAVPDELFFAGAFFAVPELDELFLAVLDELFFAGAFFAVPELDELFLAVPDELFFAGAFFAVEEADFFAGDVFFAALFCALEVLFFAVDELDDFLAVEPPDAFFATDAALLPGPLLAAAAAAFLAGADAFLATSDAFGSFGSFFWPDTTALRSAPAVNLGIAVFFAFTRSPVRGLRTHRASRMRFSNEPKPVIATFSPRATSRVMVSSTDSSACCACFRLPS